MCTKKLDKNCFPSNCNTFPSDISEGKLLHEVTGNMNIVITNISFFKDIIQKHHSKVSIKKQFTLIPG